MDEFVFPDIKAHCSTVNGKNLVFRPGFASVLETTVPGLDLLQNCAGLSVSEARQWLRERYGERYERTADSLVGLIKSGFFDEPKIDCAELESDPPQVISFGIGVTHRCNMQCRYCFASGQREAAGTEDISPETARLALDFLFDELRPPWVTIVIGITGEPTLRWDLVNEIVSYAQQKSEERCVGVNFHVTTNGRDVSPEMLEYLQTHDDMSVVLSWDGPPEIHNQQRLSRSGVDTYESVNGAFDALRHTLKSRPAVAATVSALNPDVSGIFAHLFDKGVRDFIIKPLRGPDPELGVTEESLPAFKAAYAQLAEQLLTPDHAQIERLFSMLKGDDYLGRRIIRFVHRHRMPYRCGAASAHLEVDTNGDIYPCPSLVGVTSLRVGNIRTGLDESARKSFRKNTFCNNLQACENCWAKYYCGGPCAHVSMAASGQTDIPYQPDCELTKYLIELAGYMMARLNRERPGLLAHVVDLREAVPMGRRPEATCERVQGGGLWTKPVEDWRSANPITLAGKEQAGGSKQWPNSLQISAQVHLKWDDDFFYLMAEVEDKFFLPPRVVESEWWFMDSIQFAMDPQGDAGSSIYPWRLPDGDYEYGIAQVDGESYLYDCQEDPLRPSRSGNALVTRVENSTIYQVAIPWKQIAEFTPCVGAECRFSVVVNDCDAGIRGWLGWTNGLAVRKLPARFGLLRLVEHSANG